MVSQYTVAPEQPVSTRRGALVLKTVYLNPGCFHPNNLSTTCTLIGNTRVKTPGLYPIKQTTVAVTPENGRITLSPGQHIRIENPHTHTVSTHVVASNQYPLKFVQRVMRLCWMDFDRQLLEAQRKWGRVQHEDFENYIAECTIMNKTDWVATGRKEMHFRGPPIICRPMPATLAGGTAPAGGHGPTQVELETVVGPP
ncbi:hypothetical protein APHAL10511_000403 [Amanita phalloides]|nr:hypothetical protein APHAL10511_000403 [Amanita phalloides]